MTAARRDHRPRSARVCVLIAVTLACVAGPVHAQRRMQSFEVEARYHHVPLPVDGIALTSFVVPEDERIESIEVSLVNDAAVPGNADIVVIASDERGQPVDPRLDLCFPVRVTVAAHADTLMRVRPSMPAAGLVASRIRDAGREDNSSQQGVRVFVGAVILSEGLTVRMDRSASADAGMRHPQASVNLFGLPKKDTTGMVYGSRFDDSRLIGNWYIAVTTTRIAPRPRDVAAAPTAVRAAQSAPQRLVQTQRGADGSVKSEMSIRSSYAVNLTERSSVDLRIVDAVDRSVRVLAADSLPPGTHFFSWDGRTTEGAVAASGEYHMVLRINGTEQERHRLVHP